MPTLAEIQSFFRDAVVAGNTQRVLPLLNGGCDPGKRLAIHQRNYHASLVDALTVKFPATAWLVGSPFLIQAAEHFVREHPPEAPCIAEYGAAFPEFLTHCPGAGRLPYLREFAQLEWFVGQISIAVDGSPSGLYYLHASWPVDELLQLYLTDSVPDRFELSPTDVWIEVRGARGEFQLKRVDERRPHDDF